MNVEELVPTPYLREIFAKRREVFIPDATGCYVLTTFGGDVLYLGLTNNLRRRMREHLESENKTRPTYIGRATFIYWLQTSDVNLVERTWQNIFVQAEGKLPLLNKLFSPVNT